MTQQRTIQDYIADARDYLEVSAREFDAGDDRQGAKKLYGAACSAIEAVSLRYNWPCGRHRLMKRNAHQLRDLYGDSIFVAGFLAAEKFHAHFFHNIMEDYDIVADRPIVSEFIDRVLELADVTTDGSPAST